jgi:hypothetical protein
MIQLLGNLDDGTPALDKIGEHGLEGAERRRGDVIFRRFGGKYVLHHSEDFSRNASKRGLLPRRRTRSRLLVNEHDGIVIVVIVQVADIDDIILLVVIEIINRRRRPRCGTSDSKFCRRYRRGRRCGGGMTAKKGDVRTTRWRKKRVIHATALRAGWSVVEDSATGAVILRTAPTLRAVVLTL